MVYLGILYRKEKNKERILATEGTESTEIKKEKDFYPQMKRIRKFTTA